jgi:hypothetical protein
MFTHDKHFVKVFHEEHFILLLLAEDTKPPLLFSPTCKRPSRLWWLICVYVYPTLQTVAYIFVNLPNHYQGESEGAYVVSSNDENTAFTICSLPAWDKK